MSTLETIIASIIAGLAVAVIVGIFTWFLPRKKSKSISQKTNIKGDGNTVINTIKDKKE